MILIFMVLFIVFLSLSVAPGQAAETVNVSPCPIRKIYIPRDDFDEFMRSRHNAGLFVMPLSDLRDKVIEDFHYREKLNSPPVKISEDKDFIIQKATFKACEEYDSLRLKADYDILVKKEGWYSVPIAWGDLTLSAANIDKQKLVVSAKGSSAQHSVFSAIFHAVKANGTKHIQIELIIPIRKIDYFLQAECNLLPAPSGRLNLELKGTHLDVTVNSGLQTAHKERDDKTILDCALEPSSKISIQWFHLSSRVSGPKNSHKPDPASGTENTSGKAWISAELFNDVEIGEGRIKGVLSTNFEVFRKSVKSLSFKIPSSLDHIERLPSGDLLKSISRSKDRTRLVVEFRRAVTGKHSFDLAYFDDSIETIPEISMVNANRETGYIAIRRRNNARVMEADRSSNIEPASMSSIPARYQSAKVRKALLFYRYLRHPYHLTLQVTQYRNAAAQTTVVDKSLASTLIAGDGACFTQLELYIRSRLKEPLQLDFSACGPDATVDEVFLDGKPTSLSLRGGGKVDVSLGAISGSAADTPHILKMVFHHRTETIRRISGKLALSLPALIDVPVKETYWVWHVPSEQLCFSFNGNFTHESSWYQAPPINKGRSAYNHYAVRRQLLPGGAFLSVDCAYVESWIAWFPSLVMLAAGVLIAHCALVIMLGGKHSHTCVSILLVVFAMFVFFRDQVESQKSLVTSGIILYICSALIYAVVILFSSIRPRKKRKLPVLSPVETNIARVDTLLTGGDGNA